MKRVILIKRKWHNKRRVANCRGGCLIELGRA